MSRTSFSPSRASFSPSRASFSPSLSRAALLLALLTLAPALAHAEDQKSPASTQVTRVEELINDWDIDGAKTELEALAKVMPPDAEPVKYFRGRIAFEEGRYDEAVKLLTEAGIDDKEGSYLRLAKDTRDIVKGHQTVESEHFIFYFPPGKDQILAPYALEALEAQRKALAEDLGYTPPGRIRVEVVNNAAELSKVSTLTKEQIKTTGTIAICKFNKLMVTSPKAVVTGYDWLDTLAHEYTHLVVSKKSHNSVPIWLHEGLAKFLESRWRGKAGLALTPSTEALLGRRVKQDKLIPFEKMHPSIAMLPSAEDAATAFAEVFYAIDFITRQKGTEGLRAIIEGLRDGKTDRDAVASAMGMPFPSFERAWLSFVKAQPFPKELLPLEDKVVLKENVPGKAKQDQKKKGKEISYGEFAQIEETDARKYAHLGELLRERNRTQAAATEYAKAHKLVGDKYDVLSDKYALALLDIGRLDDAEQVLQGSLRVHPSVASTHVHLGRIYLARKDWKQAKAAYTEALAVDPFDPEIHLALTYVHGKLGEGLLEERTRKATALLTQIPEKNVARVAEQFANSHALADVNIDADGGTKQ